MEADGGWDYRGTHRTYGNESFHRHTEAAIRDVLTQFCVDRNRIYGYGLSMGGGNVLNYTARHLDPPASEGMFAAAINHTGSVAFPIEYFNGNATNPPVCNTSCTPLCDSTLGLQCSYNCLYSNDPTKNYCTDRFLFQRATVLDILCNPPDSGSNCPDPMFDCPSWPTHADTSLSRNHRDLPVRSYYYCNDDSRLESMNLQLDSFMTSQ